MGDTFELQKQRDEAIINNLSHSMVYLLRDKVPGKVENGTAVLVDFRGYTYLVSAIHNFDEETGNDALILKNWSETKFNFRDGGTLQLHHDPSIPEHPRFSAGTKLSTTGRFLTNREFDLIALRLEPSEMIPSAARPIVLEERQYTGDIKKGAPLVTIGTPFDGALKLPNGQRALHPHKFEVPYDPDVPKPQIKSKYLTSDYLLYPYAHRREGVSPHGYSGAPVWSFEDIEDVASTAIWSVRPRIAGIVIKHFGHSNLIGAVRIQRLIALLESGASAGDTLPEGAQLV